MNKLATVLLMFSLALGVHSTGPHSCQPPPVPKNGGTRGALQSSYDIGGYVEFLCNPGFKLQGDSLTVCIDTQDGGVWNKPTPICVRKSSLPTDVERNVKKMYYLRFSSYLCACF